MKVSEIMCDYRLQDFYTILILCLPSSSDVRYLEFGVTCKLDVGRICPIERGQLEKMMSCNQHSNSVSEIKKFLQTSLFVLSRSSSSHINMKIMQN